MSIKRTDWKTAFTSQAEKYHKIGAWVAIILNPIWAVGDYILMPDYWQEFLIIRVVVSLATFITFFWWKKVKFPPEWLVFVPFVGIALQNAYMYSLMEPEPLQKHTLAYIALFIGAGMLVLWRPLYSYIVVGINLLACLILFPLQSPLGFEEVMVNGGLLTFTVTIFTIILIQTRYSLTVKEIKARLALEDSKIQIEQKNKDITDSIRYAQRIQHAILPAEESIKKSLPESFVYFQPKDIVSGDFYWFSHDRNTTFITAVDCTGHGVPGAFMSMIGNDLLNQTVKEKGKSRPAEILDELKKGVTYALSQSAGKQATRDGMDMAFCAISELTGNGTGKLQFAGANNPLWLIRSDVAEAGDLKAKADKTLSQNGYTLYEVKADKQPIGYTEMEEPYTNHEIELQKGDAFYVFSDGYPDQFGGPKGKKLKYKTLKKMLLDIQEHSMEKQKKILHEKFEKWKMWTDENGVQQHCEQIDDVCVIGVRV